MDRGGRLADDGKRWYSDGRCIHKKKYELKIEGRVWEGRVVGEAG